MGDPFRGDYEALQARIETLRRELDDARHGSEQLEETRRELEAKLTELERARQTELEKGPVGRRIRWRGIAAGAMAAVMLVGGGYVAVDWVAGEPAEAAAHQSWFERIRPSCNPVEVSVAVDGDPPPNGWKGQAHLAACYALAGRIGEAGLTLDALSSEVRPRAASIVFRVVRPVADAGDTVAAGRAMELVLDYLPDHDMALYHAGMYSHETDRTEIARSRLERFLELHEADDRWRETARSVLEGLPQPRRPDSATPGREVVGKAMKSAAGAVGACSDGGVATAKVTFAGETGRAVRVHVRGDVGGQAARACIARALRQVELPPFGAERFTVSFPYRLGG